MSDKKILPLKNDTVFHIFFADPRNSEHLRNFLTAALRLPESEYEKIEIINPQLLPEYVGQKTSVVDLKLHTKTGKIIHIEIQLKVTKEFLNRIVFYASKLIAEQLGEGDKFKEINQTISIVITDEKLIPENELYHHRFTLYDLDAQVELSDLLEIYSLELQKLPNESDGSPLYNWAKFINADTEEELEMIARSSPQLAQAVVRLRELSADEKARDLYERRIKAQRDLEMFREDSEQKGSYERALTIARKMLKRGKSIEEIMEFTDLPSEEIEKIVL